jgi:hypothetical protein
LPPRNLVELRRFLGSYYVAPQDPAPPPVTDALGAELNTTVSAFGTPWEYDANEGRVKLPDVCNLDALFHNARELVPDD